MFSLSDAYGSSAEVDKFFIPAEQTESERVLIEACNIDAPKFNAIEVIKNCTEQSLQACYKCIRNFYIPTISFSFQSHKYLPLKFTFNTDVLKLIKGRIENYQAKIAEIDEIKYSLYLKFKKFSIFKLAQKGIADDVIAHIGRLFFNVHFSTCNNQFHVFSSSYLRCVDRMLWSVPDRVLIEQVINKALDPTLTRYL